MDYIRFALITALAIVSYLLLLAWNEDYPAQAPATQAPQGQISATNPASDLPTDLPPATGVPAADVPQAPQATAQPSTTGQTAGFVTVRTPVQLVTIDLNGGDIVSLALPRYPVSLDAPDVPFQLLQNNNRVYVSQSGLIGPDGPDASPDGRPR